MRLDAKTQWATFRGPGSKGIASSKKAPPIEFGKERNLLWSAKIPSGHASPIVWGDRVFVSAHDKSAVELRCLDRSNGKTRWRRRLPIKAFEKVHRVNSLASSTPACDGKRVYAFFGSFGLICFDLDGNEIWRREIATPKNIFGAASSPTVVGDTLIFHNDNQGKSWLEAIDGPSGDVRWRIEREGFVSGWSTPVVWNNGGVDEVLVYGAFRLVAYDLRDGKERWSVPGLADEPCVTPVTGSGLVFVSSYNMRTNPEVLGLPKFAKLLEELDSNKNGTLNRSEAAKNKSVLSRSDADGEGDHPLRIFFRWLDRNRDGELDAKEYDKLRAWLGSFKHKNALVAIRPGDGDERPAEIVWQYPHGVPECPSPLYHAGHVYLVKNGGLATCLDAKTGEARWQARLGARGPRYSSPVVAGDRIFACSARGTVTVYRGRDKLEVLASHDLGERIMATPAIVGAVLYVRTAKRLYAFGEAL